MAFGVCADLGNVAHVVYPAVFCDVIMIAAFGEALPLVHGVEGGRGEITGAAGGGAMHHNERDVSLFDHCFVGDYVSNF